MSDDRLTNIRVDTQAAKLYVWWCPICEKQTERQWHLYRRGPALIPQLDEEHMCERIEVVRAARLEAYETVLHTTEQALADAHKAVVDAFAEVRRSEL